MVSRSFGFEGGGVKGRLAILALLALAFMAPVMVGRFYVYLLALILVTGLLATSLNLVLGFGGMYQFHHAVFYGAGAYGTALCLTHTDLSPWLALLAGPLAAAALSLVLGLICVRHDKLYFGMLQISLGSLVWAVVYRWYDLTGGDDGIHGIAVPQLLSSGKNAYYFVLVVTLICLILMYRLLQSPYGQVFQSIRDNPERAAMVGVDVRLHQLIGLVLAGTFAGVAGVLFVVVEGSVFPDLMFWTLSLEILIMCLLGGWFTFLGPMLGAAVIVGLRTSVGIYTDYWTLVLGILLMLLIFFLPDGVLGLFAHRPHQKQRKPEANDA